jgi:hypothetical protein
MKPNGNLEKILESAVVIRTSAGRDCSKFQRLQQNKSQRL